MEGGPAVIDTFVTIEGFDMFFRIIQGGKPVVLFEAGGGWDSSEWDDIAPKVAARTGATVVCYDRAGFGKSDLPDIPCDMRVEAGWLWTALEHLGLDHDVILAGHSYGGWMIRMEADEKPDAVKGIVFIDPFSHEFVEAMGVEYLDEHPMTGKHPFDTSDPDKLTKTQKALVRMVDKGLEGKLAIMRETRVPAGIPVFLIKSFLQTWPKESEQEAWDDALDRMAGAIEGA
ncbi:MAG TPA: alpha/beta fold hydrolase, partial [Candidatus Krumholzibacterium sp.]|nr:alpha/beta fold hydrolase [Candidatus Krumholzibacterium sp.]